MISAARENGYKLEDRFGTEGLHRKLSKESWKVALEPER